MVAIHSAKRTAVAYQRSRFYNPEQGRFLTFDSYAGDVREPKSLHKYLYTEGNPVNHIDPSGQISLSGALVTVGALSIGAATALPAIRGAWNSSYHVAADGQRESLFAATFNGAATWQWRAPQNLIHVL
jgi:RHS repeat-associated protein